MASRTYLPQAALLRVAEERGVAPNTYMIQLRKQSGQPPRVFRTEPDHRFIPLTEELPRLKLSPELEAEPSKRPSRRDKIQKVRFQKASTLDEIASKLQD
jgi:hypothetical protein